MTIDHIGFLTHDIDKTINSFKALGFVQESEIIINNGTNNPEKDSVSMFRNLAICFMANGVYRIELVSPISEDSVVTNILKKQGAGPYHICYQTYEIHEKIIELRSQGWMLIQKPERSNILGGAVAFLFKRDMGFLELREI